MYFLSKRFWYEYRFNPRQVLQTLHDTKSRTGFAITKFVLFLRIVYVEYMANHCFMRASALSFALILSLIPLMTSVSYMLSNVMEVNPHYLQQVLALFLPFAPPVLLESFSAFFSNAQKLRGISIAVLLLVTIGLFAAVEQSLNSIWKVNKARSFFIQLRTFTMVAIYTPLLFLTSLQIRKNIELNFINDYYFYFPVDVLPFLFSVLAFTTLIWFVPNTRVKFKYSIVGGLFAGIFYELERHTFLHYVQLSIQTKTIYGAFGILPFFMISLFFVSMIILLGAQIAYVLQNFWPLLRAITRGERRVNDFTTYLGFRILLDIVESFSRGTHPPSLSFFSARYELTESQAQGILSLLTRLNLIHSLGNGNDTYVPARDLCHELVKDIIHMVDGQHHKIPISPDDFSRAYLSKIFDSMKDFTIPGMENMTLGWIINELANGSKRFTRAAGLEFTH